MNLKQAKNICRKASTDSLWFQIMTSKKGNQLEQVQQKTSIDKHDPRMVLIPRVKCQTRFLATFWDLCAGLAEDHPLRIAYEKRGL